MSRKKSILMLLWIQMASSKNIVESPLFYFYHGTSTSDHSVYKLYNSDHILRHPEFNVSRSTVVYIHGFLDSVESESVDVIVSAYVENKNYNILVLDWSTLVARRYFLESLPNCLLLGPLLAKKILLLFEYGLDSKKLHLVGHSLGAHLAGLVGREIIHQSQGKYKIQRITGLDPAFAGFYPEFLVKHLNKMDAELVDVIHTDALFYGTPFSTGTVDFWPNRGILQPGCPIRDFILFSDNDSCSHERAWWFWAESVKNVDGRKFSASHCHEEKSCKRKNESMGIDCSSKAKGNYFLNTNGKMPFSL